LRKRDSDSLGLVEAQKKKKTMGRGGGKGEAAKISIELKCAANAEGREMTSLHRGRNTTEGAEGQNRAESSEQKWEREKKDPSSASLKAKPKDLRNTPSTWEIHTPCRKKDREWSSRGQNTRETN